jgi:hypothetical protein
MLTRPFSFVWIDPSSILNLPSSVFNRLPPP